MPDPARLAVRPKRLPGDRRRVTRELEEALSRWQEAGLLDGRAAQAILEFEAAAAPAEAEPARVTAGEVIGYAGLVLVVGGLGYLVGNQGESLGPVGRSLVFAAVTVAGLAVAWVLSRRALSEAGQRARQVGVGLSSVAFFFLVAEVTRDTAWLTVTQTVTTSCPPTAFCPAFRPIAIKHEDWDFFVAAVGGAAMGLGGLLWTRRLLPALAFVILTAVAAGYLGGALGLGSEETRWLPWAAAGLLVLAVGEGLPLLSRPAREVARLAALAVPEVAANVIHGGATVGLDLVTVPVALGAFALAVRRSSLGYAVAGGLGLFAFILDLGGRYFARTVGLPLTLLVAGLALIGLSVVAVRVRDRFTPAP
ncbi:MAG: hypothetical protein ACYDAY_07585 [Candidatus Dormibacteria bacterium]